MPGVAGWSTWVAGALLAASCSFQQQADPPAAVGGGAPALPVVHELADSVPFTMPMPMPPVAAGAGSPGAAQGGAGVVAGSGAGGTWVAQGGAGAAAPGLSPPTAAPAAGSGSDPTAPTAPDHGHGLGSSAQQNGVLTASFAISAIPPGVEAHQCVIVELPNSAPAWVDRIHAKLSSGSHHLIVDRATGTPTLTEAQDCAPTMGNDATRLWLAQQPDSRLSLPDGVAFPLDAHQPVFLQLHYFNAGSNNSEVSASVELNTLAQSQKPVEAKSLFTGNTAITLLPQQTGSVRFFMQPSVTGAPVRHVFALSSHTHQLAVRTTIERVAAEDAPESKPIHESRDWAEPPLTVFDGPLEFNGTDGLRLICRYMNTENRTVSFGTATTDEMCFMWMYYFER